MLDISLSTPLIVGIVVVVGMLLVTVLFLAKWGLISKEVIERVMVRAEELGDDAVKQAFRSEFTGDRSMAGRLVSTVVDKIDPKKQTPSRARRVLGFLGRAAIDMIPGMRR